MCEKSCCDSSVKCCKKKIKIKRFFFPLFFGIFSVFFKETRDFVYFPLIISCCFFVLFWNFPGIVYYTASKPLYYQDIFIDEKKLPNYNVNTKIKNKFECIFVWVLIVTNTLLIGGLSEYWLFKSLDQQTVMEILGTTGGIIKIFQIVNNTICRIMLKVLKGYVKSENKKFEKLQVDRVKSIINLKIKEKANVLEMVEAQMEQKRHIRDRVQSF
tara:strand:+ start:8395 stop:9036 length:642 start_codon:yes stop_codon:yes gene_type:complete